MIEGNTKAILIKMPFKLTEKKINHNLGVYCDDFAAGFEEIEFVDRDWVTSFVNRFCELLEGEVRSS